MHIELVVFDIAGTTVRDDDSVNRCLRAALEAAGIRRTAAAVNRVMGLPKPEAIAILVQEAGLMEPPPETLARSTPTSLPDRSCSTSATPRSMRSRELGACSRD